MSVTKSAQVVAVPDTAALIRFNLLPGQKFGSLWTTCFKLLFTTKSTSVNNKYSRGTHLKRGSSVLVEEKTSGQI